MSKFYSSLLPLLSCMIVLNVLASNASAQTEQTEQVNIESSEVVEVEQELADKNNFELLLKSEQVVWQLTKNYGVKGSVELSKTLWRILTSFSNEQQAKNVWQTAIKQLQEVDSTGIYHVSVVNSQYNAGRVLAQFTHGMTIDKWNASRKRFNVSKKNLNDLFELSDDLTIYFNLYDIWSVLLADIVKQPEIHWQEVFSDSLDLFAEALDEKIIEEDNKDNGVDFYDLMSQWQASENRNTDLADVLKFMATQNETQQLYYQSVIRFLLDKQQERYLSASQSWFAVAEQLYLKKETFDESSIEKVNAFIEKNDAWFLSKESFLLAINEQLPVWVESSFHNLKAFYRGTGDVQEADLMPVYQIISTGFDKYMDTPFRRKIQKDLEVCLNISEEFVPLPQQPIDLKQFRGCINDMVVAATTEASIRELSGTLTKVDSQQALDRALLLPPWQTVNLLYAKVAKNNCLQDIDQLVNPFEWTLSAEALLWFADRWPAYMRNYPEQNQINKIIAQGERWTKDLSCLEKSKQQILDSQFTQIVQSWENVKNHIGQVINEFNDNHLTKGSDVDLLDSVEKQSNYRVEKLTIKECNAQASCGVHIELESSRALFGLFPNHLRVADQLKMGTLNLCYDKVGWEDRRAASTHLNNDSVANYFGRFSFSLKGFYNDELVFERKLTDEKEELYLFAENSDDVLNIYCPLEIVGDNISTSLKEGTYGLVPNRLTFLTASRANEDQILKSNWSSGAEWKDQIITAQAQQISSNDLNAMSSDVHKTFQIKAAELQDLIYQTLLARNANPTEAQQQLTEAFLDVQRAKVLFSALNYFLQMDDLMINDELHGLLFGENTLPDVSEINEFYQNQVNINLLISSVEENLLANKEKWNESQKALSHSHINQMLFRLKSINP